MKATEGADVEIERRCGMVTGASCGHVTLSWIPETAETAPAHGCWPPMTAAASAASG